MLKSPVKPTEVQRQEQNVNPYADRYEEKDNQKEATGDDDKDLTAEMETLTIDPNKKASGGKRKTKRKNKKSKKSSRKKRKHRKTRKSKK